MDRPLVGILMGSASDLPVMRSAQKVLADLEVTSELRIRSAHRTPEASAEYAATCEERGIRVLICGAGMAAHLAGVMAAGTSIPVIGVPIGASIMGLDALLATVQMPPGVPVATVAVGKAGAANAGWLAARILALSDPALRTRLDHAIRQKAEAVLAADAQLVRGELDS